MSESRRAFVRAAAAVGVAPLAPGFTVNIHVPRDDRSGALLGSWGTGHPGAHALSRTCSITLHRV